MTNLSPFSIQLTRGSFDRGARADVGSVAAERRKAMAKDVRVEIRPGSLHDRYPVMEGDGEPVAVVTDRALIRRLAKAVTDQLPGTSSLTPQHTDLILDVANDEDDTLMMLHIAGGRVHDAATGAVWVVDDQALADVLAAAAVPPPYLPSMSARGTPKPTLQSPAGQELTQRWLHNLPGSRPVNYELRTALSHRWVRFHSLPDSKRYADNEFEYLEILRRHHDVLEALAGGSDVLVITSSWSVGLAVEERPVSLEAITGSSWFWDTVIVAQDDDLIRCIHLWVETVDRDDERLDQLLRMAADGYAYAVIVADPDLQWLYSPYDGGADVIAANQQHRDALAAQFRKWLPTDGPL